VRAAVLIAIKAQALLALTQEQLGVIVRASGRSSKHRTVLWATVGLKNHALHGLLDARLRGHDIVFPACPSAYRPGPTPASEQLGVIVRASGRSSKHRTMHGATLRFQITPLHGLLDARLRGHDIVFPACPSAYRPGPTPASEQLGVIVRASGRFSKHRTVLGATLRFQITPCTDYWMPAFAGMTTEIVFPACPSAYRPGPTPAFGGADCTVRQKHSKNNQAA
jgi:hypothetical protein